MFFIDGIGQQFIPIPKQELRIVSLVPSQTELLVDMGLEKQLIGITKFCVHPSYLKKNITIVGGTKKVSKEKIKDLKPNLILCNKEENTKAIVKELKEIAAVWVTEVYTVDYFNKTIRNLGEFFGVEKVSSEILEQIAIKEIEFQRFIYDKPQKKVLYLIWKDPYMAAGKNTFINNLLLQNKFINVLEDDSRYPEVTPDCTPKPDVILLSSEPYPFSEKHQKKIEEEWQVPTMLVDGEYFSWYGSRLLHAFDYFIKLHI